MSISILARAGLVVNQLLGASFLAWFWTPIANRRQQGGYGFNLSRFHSTLPSSGHHSFLAGSKISFPANCLIL
jgi:hypothetical protein